MDKRLAVVQEACPSLAGMRVTPHVLRHTAAMELPHNGFDRAAIALWLGHESVETTFVFLHADLKLKEAAVAKTSPTHGTPGRYRPERRLGLPERTEIIPSPMHENARTPL